MKFPNDERTIEALTHCLQRFSMHVNDKPYVSCKEHASGPAFFVRPAGSQKIYKICGKCYDLAFPEAKSALFNPEAKPIQNLLPQNRVVPRVQEIDHYVCSFDKDGEECTNPVDYHDSCRICRAHFCREHMPNGLTCNECADSFEGGSSWMN